MKRSLQLSLAGGVALAAAIAVPSSAHHSFATEFNSKKPLLVEGDVTRARLVNPHSWVYIDVKNRDGTVTNWGFEFSTPMGLRQKDIDRADLAFGTHLRLSGFRSKNGGAFGYAASVAFPSGRIVQVGGAPDAPALALR